MNILTLYNKIIPTLFKVILYNFNINLTVFIGSGLDFFVGNPVSPELRKILNKETLIITLSQVAPPNHLILQSQNGRRRLELEEILAHSQIEQH
jgi:hypothetical protein